MQDDPTIIIDDENSSHDYLVEVEVLGEIDRYKVLRKLGQGAFCSVYLAYDSISELQVALKTLPREFILGEARERTRRNFSLISRLSHPNICNSRHLHEVIKVDQDILDLTEIRSGDYLLVMDYLEGLTVTQFRAHGGGRIDMEDVLYIGKQIAFALDYAHEQEIVHRDIKPSNLIINQKLETSVLDFGLAASLENTMQKSAGELHQVCGTRRYMAPEQWMGNRQGPSTDQYALAIVLYELLTGNVPNNDVFSNVSLSHHELKDIVLSSPFPKMVGFSNGINRVFKKAMAFEQSKRYKSCADMLFALEKAHDKLKNRTFLLAALILFLATFTAFSVIFILAEPTNQPNYTEEEPSLKVLGSSLTNLRTQALVANQKINKAPNTPYLNKKKEELQSSYQKTQILVAERETEKAITAYEIYLNQVDQFLQAASEYKRLNRTFRHHLNQWKDLASNYKETGFWSLNSKAGQNYIKSIQSFFKDGKFQAADQTLKSLKDEIGKLNKLITSYEKFLVKKKQLDDEMKKIDQIKLAIFLPETYQRTLIQNKLIEQYRVANAYGKASEIIDQQLLSMSEWGQQIDKAEKAQTTEQNYEAQMQQLLALKEHLEHSIEAYDKQEIFESDAKEYLVASAEFLRGQDISSPILNELKNYEQVIHDELLILAKFSNLSEAIYLGDEEAPLSLAFIPPGSFWVGITEFSDDYWSETLQQFLHIKYTENYIQTIKEKFWISRFEITNKAFKYFVDETNYVLWMEREKLSWSIRPKIDDAAPFLWPNLSKNWDTSYNFYPVLGIHYKDAVAFCEWYTEKLIEEKEIPRNHEIRLPNIAEWEYSMQANESRVYNFWFQDDKEFAKNSANVRDQDFFKAHSEAKVEYPNSLLLKEEQPIYLENANSFPWSDGHGGPAPIDSYKFTGKNPFGVSDMVGNAIEWVQDGQHTYILKGGSWASNILSTAKGIYLINIPKSVRKDAGFRVVLAPKYEN